MTMPSSAARGIGLEYPIRVLFLCTGNSARSQIAEALVRRKGGDRFIVASAGAHPASEVRPEAIAALQHQGIDWTGHQPKGLDAIVEDSWDLVITLCDRIKETCPTFPTRPVTAHWGAPDPADITDPVRRTAAFSDTLGLLSWRIDLMLALRIDRLETMVLQERLRAIPKEEPPSGGNQ